MNVQQLNATLPINQFINAGVDPKDILLPHEFISNGDLLAHDIEPLTLKFVVYLNEQSSCVVQLTNTSHHHVAFKVKTTVPKKYCVRPNIGVVEPKSSCEFTVTMRALKERPQDMLCKDRFLIVSTAVPAETTDEDIIHSMLSNVESEDVEKIKLRVNLVLPSDSPELSQINGTPKPPERSHMDTDDGKRITATNNLDAPMMKTIDLQKTDQITKGSVEIKLVKDIEELKLRVDALESMLKQAELRISKIVKEAQIGFPLLFVCILAFISICIGYYLRT